MRKLRIFKKLDIGENHSGTAIGDKWLSGGKIERSYSPVDGSVIGTYLNSTAGGYEEIVREAQKAFLVWRDIPAPKRGDIVRQMGNALRKYKSELGELVSFEMGKSYQEGLGEVQEMIDICDFATGLSRQLYGLSMHSEREQHRMYEQWHPVGLVGVISAFNFPVAVWSWNAMIAWVCGDVVIWKPSEKTPFCAIACQKIISEVLVDNNVPTAISCLINGAREQGEWLTKDGRIPLISATGSTRMGKAVGATVAERLGKTILELGGNNAMIVSPTADLKVCLTAAVFGAIGTAGQRCTSTRRLIVHEDIYDSFRQKLVSAYGQLRIGNPLDENNHMGPLIDRGAVRAYEDSLKAISDQGGKFLVEGGVLDGEAYASGCYVKPAIAEVEADIAIAQHETFAPILYLIKYRDLDRAIAIQNGVPQGLSSALMTTDLREAERFLSVNGSDCGIANINIGTSGAEIGGAFGGEKETGGGRESGSDAWKAYMRRQTNTINYSSEVPLAQGIKFDL